MVTCAPDSLCEGNVIANFSGDGLRLLRDNITAQDNVVKNGYLSAADGDQNHDDLIQVFLFNKGTGTVKGITVIGNILIGQEDLAQPFPIAELFTNTFGEYVPLKWALDGLEAVLDGKAHDFAHRDG